MAAASVYRDVVIYGAVCILQGVQWRQEKKRVEELFVQFQEHTGSARTALVFGGLLLMWWAVAAWRQEEPPAAGQLFAACENGHMALRTTPTEKGGNEADATCQPFTSRLIAVNHADAAALTAVPGIGMATAEKIIADREQHGQFHSAADLTRVRGIGTTKAGHFAAYLSFE